jgi:hypothetical protein
MAFVLPVTSLFLGVHAVVFAFLSLRVGLFRAGKVPTGKDAETFPGFKNISSVSCCENSHGNASLEASLLRRRQPQRYPKAIHASSRI